MLRDVISIARSILDVPVSACILILSFAPTLYGAMHMYPWCIISNKTSSFISLSFSLRVRKLPKAPFLRFFSRQTAARTAPIRLHCLHLHGIRTQHSTELRYTTYRAPFGDLAVSTLQTASSEPARCNVRSVCILLKGAVYPPVETRRRFDASTICRLPRTCGVRRQIPLRTAMSRGLAIPGRPDPWGFETTQIPTHR
jgi:hypothetical protein